MSMLYVIFRRDGAGIVQYIVFLIYFRFKTTVGFPNIMAFIRIYVFFRNNKIVDLSNCFNENSNSDALRAHYLEINAYYLPRIYSTYSVCRM